MCLFGYVGLRVYVPVLLIVWVNCEAAGAVFLLCLLSPKLKLSTFAKLRVHTTTKRHTLETHSFRPRKQLLVSYYSVHRSMQ